MKKFIVRLVVATALIVGVGVQVSATFSPLTTADTGGGSGRHGITNRNTLTPTFWSEHPAPNRPVAIVGNRTYSPSALRRGRNNYTRRVASGVRLSSNIRFD